MSENIATEVAAIIESFSAEQRASAIADQQRQKVTVARQLAPGSQVVFEAVIDRASEQSEIDGLLDRLVAATDRQEAMIQLAAHLGQLRLDQGLLERQKKDYARNNAKFVAEDEARSARRHAVNDVTVDPKHRSALDQIRTGIEETQAQIEERIWTIDECRRIIAGQTRLEAIETTMRLREKAAEAKRAA